MKYFFLSLLFVVCSCKVPTNVVYFQESENLEEIPNENTFTPVFKVDDIISILVSSSDMAASRPFNKMQGASLDLSEGGSASEGGSEPTYLIDEDGNIDFPILGKLKVAGLTRTEVKELIKEQLKIYINDPVVSIRLKNFKITLMGEVRAPGAYTIPNERITIIEALGLGQDLTIKGNRENILVIRENEGKNTYHRVDLTSKNIFESPVYYLAQNDVLYVEPNVSKIRESQTKNDTLGIIISVVGVLISVATFATR